MEENETTESAEQDDILIVTKDVDSGEVDELSIKTYILDAEKDWQQRSMGQLCTAEYNERMISGDQFIQVGATHQIEEGDFWTGDQQKSSRNHLANLALTWSSRVLEERPSIQCYPNEAGADLNKAEACNKILEYVKQNHDFDDLCFEAAQLVQPHSAVAFKVVWDPLSGPRSQGVQKFDENGFPQFDELGQPILEYVGAPLGDVSITLASIFDYFGDGSEKIEDSEFVCFREVISKSEARRLLNMSPQFENIDLQEDEFTNAWGIKKSGVLLRELWIRPRSYQFPDGLFAIMVGERVVSAIAFPYDHGELPIAVWKCGKRRGSEFGVTHVTHAVNIQSSINYCCSAIDVQSKQIAGIKLLAHQSIIDMMQHGNQQIPVQDPSHAQYAKYLEPPDRAKVLVSTLEDSEKALYAVFGLNELLTGAETIKSGTAAKAVEFLNRLDSMKMAGASRSLNKGILRIFKQVLKLYQQYVKAPRIAQILGKGNLYEPLQFIGADISGVDVRLEPISGFTQFRAGIAEQAQMQIDAGNVTPQLQSQAQTGLKQDSFDKSQRDMIGSQIDATIKGQLQQADPTLDPNIAVDEILGVISAYQGTPIFQNLMMLLQGYRDSANQQAAQMAAQQPPEGQMQ
jgi:hypothetical protein